MHLVEIFLPIKGERSSAFAKVRDELTEHFGGVTAFTRAPAQGVWHQHGKNIRDDIVVVEVMVETLDARWWTSYREELEQHFAQEQILIRATATERL